MALDLNSLSGEIPPELGDMGSIERLRLSGNLLDGEVPSELAQLSTLVDGDGIDLRWNMLSSDEPSLIAFLTTKQIEGGDWLSFQTVAPENLDATVLGADAVELSWDPVDYSWDQGGYQILAATSSGGPFQEVGRTESKEADLFVVSGLEPETTYFFVVRTVTQPHGGNFNTLVSGPSSEVSATTEAGAACQVGCQASVQASAAAGEDVAFDGEAAVTGCDLEVQVRWWFGDGQTADSEGVEPAPTPFQGRPVDVRGPGGSATCADSGTITVSAPDADCGNGLCEEGETAWACETDCGFAADETGRVMGGGTDFVVPAAVGGVTGIGAPTG